MSRIYLGIDAGTGSIKVVALDEEGQLVGATAREYPLSHPEPGAAEQDPDRRWTALVDAMGDLDPALREGVVAIGLSGQMHGTVLLDENGRPAHPTITWADIRSGPQAEAIERDVGRQRLGELTGTAMAAGFQAASIRWLRERKPVVWADVAHVLLPKDELRLRLTGERATEPSDAASTGMLDLHGRDWSRLVLDAVGIRSEQLPPVRRSAEVTGNLTPHAAAALRLMPGLPVVGGAGDAPAGAVAVGAVDQGDVLLTLSTGAQALAPLAEPRVDPELRLHTFASALDPARGEAGWYVMGATMVAGLALRWLRDNVFEMTGADALERLSELAGLAPPGANGLLFLPYLAGERTPHFDPVARGVFLGLSTDHGQADLARAVMEGTVFALHEAFELVRNLAGEPSRVVLAGGGASSPTWRQIVADVFGLAVKPTALVEQSAAGAAILAAAAHTGERAGDIARRWARFGPIVEPDHEATARYAELTAIYREIYPAHRDHFKRLRALSS